MLDLRRQRVVRGGVELVEEVDREQDQQREDQRPAGDALELLLAVADRVRDGFDHVGGFHLDSPAATSSCDLRSASDFSASGCGLRYRAFPNRLWAGPVVTEDCQGHLPRAPVIAAVRTRPRRSSVEFTRGDAWVAREPLLP